MSLTGRRCATTPCITRLCTKLFVVFVFLCLTGCKVGPDYHPPGNCVPDEWSAPETTDDISISYEPPPIFWWEIFNDPLLNKYIQMAACHNNDVLAAEANIFQARAIRKVSAAPLFPKISADFDAFHTFLSQNGPIDALATAGKPVAAAISPVSISQLNLFNNFIDASWELDIFGKTKRGIESSEAALESAIEQKNDILISVFGEVARNYIELRGAQKQKSLLEKNIETLQKNVLIIQKRYSTGYSNILELEQIDIQLNQALSTLPAVTTAVYRNIFAISVLTGDLPEALLHELLCAQPLPELPECLSTGLRSDLMRRRPDIREAERNLAQATANIGVAVASFFPSITLTGILGFQTLKLDNLFSSGSKTWIYGADINMPIFQGGKLVGNLKIAEAQAAALAFTYQQTVLNALRDAESALISYGEDVKTSGELKKIVASNQRLTDLNQQRYTKGLVGQLDYLNSTLILNNAELSLLQSETAALLDLVSLYKALGGGWEPFDPQCPVWSACDLSPL
ncbi:MAG: efflux transporter outer membrane subunit [Parachlamydiaceae bacterium]